MLSILIPTFNYDCRNLVSDIHHQVSSLDIKFEIRVYDDCSTNAILRKINEPIDALENVVFSPLAQNLGFCKIRNLLAKEALYENLLFLDADIEIGDRFVSNYLENNNDSTHTICGGIKYTPFKPTDNSLYLKWKHGKEREELTPEQRNKSPYRTISAANIFIKKTLFLKAKMDEEATKYGYNDTMLGYNLKSHNAHVKHISNPVLHEGLMDADKFINRSMEAMSNLIFFEKRPYIKNDFVSFIKVLKIYSILKTTKTHTWFLTYYKKNKNNWIANLKSDSPNLTNLDKLKLGTLIELKTGK